MAGRRAVVDLLTGVDETIIALVIHIAGTGAAVDKNIIKFVLLGTSEVFCLTLLTAHSLSWTGLIADNINSPCLVARMALWSTPQVHTTEVILQCRGIPLPLAPAGSMEIPVVNLNMTLQSLIFIAPTTTVQQTFYRD
jgi:hypothetical protein